MHHSLPHRVNRLHLAAALLVTLVMCMPEIAMAQASPFLTGASSLQTNILAWLTPVAIILVMVLGGLAMANRMSWGFMRQGIFPAAIRATFTPTCWRPRAR